MATLISSDGLPANNGFSIARKPVASNSVASKQMFSPLQSSEEPSEDEGTEKGASTKGPLHQTRRPFFYDWAVEVFSWLLASVALAAIVITLVVHDGRPLPQWPHLISINSLIAIFTAILKAALVMPVAEGISQLKWLWYIRPRPLIDLDRLDSASRGPWGSFLLLTRPRKHYLAAVGSLITILALAVDPFSQQIVHYNSCARLAAGAGAMIARTNSYSAFDTNQVYSSPQLDAPMTNALYTGLLNPPENASSLVFTSCITGNCTFPSADGASYSSIAMCHDCEDISSQISYNYTALTWSLPSGLGVGYAPWFARLYDLGEPTAYENAAGAIEPTQSGTFTWADIAEGLPVSAKEASQPAFSFHGLMVADTDENAKAFAFQCSLIPCVNTYLGNIFLAVLQEKLVKSVDMVQKWNLSLEPYLIATNQTLINGTWHECTPSKQSSKDHPAAVDNLYYPQDCVWQFGESSAYAISQYINTLIGNQTLISPEGLIEPQSTLGSPWIQRLYQNGTANLSSVNIYTEGLANSITATIRLRGDGGSSEYARGVTLETQTCITVQWAWIALPAALLVLAVVFLAATILKTSNLAQDAVWKSSSLALLFHGLSPGLLNQHTALGQNSEMERAAKEIRPKLEHSQAGWMFVEEYHDVGREKS